MTHVPILLKEMLLQLLPQNGSVYVDATFGAGGYSEAILKSADCKIYAIDRDETVIKFYNDLSTRYPNRIELSIEKFSKIKSILKKKLKYPTLKSEKKYNKTIECVDGVIFDVGTSSMQLDEGNRGFSFLRNGYLDMRMDKFSKINALTFVNTLCEKKIANVIYNYGGERYSRKIAKAIINIRKKKTIKTTFELADIVRSVVFRRKSKIDPATRTFQAIRIWVNDELKELEIGIKAASEILRKNGKLIVITFHSLEDRIVKTFFKNLCKQETSEHKIFSLLNKKVIRASTEEINTNPRARSAKLRAIQRLS
ncbi:MAG: 16S rRNA (cytosine(1402)-N(4))-methyltransferase RsmH [Wolbachia endosymbiont of Menacanthus eurysternus]|nr:MAG: 16S rRNA (cytosine(1402)-N(4))-methyltransferase RsmH [Wolbachia endosymbiont of Menacanthus eurysternus]